jgi:hypothetical protein
LVSFSEKIAANINGSKFEHVQTTYDSTATHCRENTENTGCLHGRFQIADESPLDQIATQIAAKIALVKGP